MKIEQGQPIITKDQLIEFYKNTSDHEFAMIGFTREKIIDRLCSCHNTFEYELIKSDIAHRLLNLRANR